MPAWNPLFNPSAPPVPLALLGALALSLGLGALYPDARPYFCPDQTPRHFNFTAASLRELASGT